MRQNQRKRLRWLWIVFAAVFVLGVFLFYNGHHWRVEVSAANFTRSAKELHNPNRGFYYIHGFRITDEEVDYEALMPEKFAMDGDNRLAMVQINLQAYRGGEISVQGMKNLENLFQALSEQKTQWILRVLYDWYGENEQYEPESLEIILGHMKQMEPLFQKYSHKIFTMQGLFIGNWGEMNGTRYSDEESMRILAKQLAEVTEDGTYLSVRMPAQWRKITHMGEITEDFPKGDSLTARLGLFNDGIMGNESDYGTYGSQSAVEAGLLRPWNRAEELSFQEALCRYVPNGGEVIVENPCNDLENAYRDMATMHITYLNRDYDRKVFEKWEKSTVHTDDCFDGMDGLSYMERHLGYRLFLEEAAFSFDFWKDSLTVVVTVGNEGFAPLYFPCSARFCLKDKESGESFMVEAPQDLQKLWGGNDAEIRQNLEVTIPLRELSGKHYEIYLSVTDSATGDRIAFANEQEEQEPGYLIGTLDL